jgi:hypothetical protein
MNHGNSIAKCEAIQIFLECLLGQFTPETIHDTLNNIEWARTPLLTIGGEARTLLSIAAIQNRRLEVIRGLALCNDTAWADLVSTETDPNISYRECTRWPWTEKGE